MIVLGGCKQLTAVRECGAKPPMTDTELNLSCVNPVPSRHVKGLDSPLRKQPVQISRPAVGPDCTIVHIGQK